MSTYNSLSSNSPRKKSQVSGGVETKFHQDSYVETVFTHRGNRLSPANRSLRMREIDMPRGEFRV